MNSISDTEFSETQFYQEREAAILQLLNPGSLMRPPLHDHAGAAVYDFSNAIHYAGCVAGSLGIPLESESVSVHLSLLYRNTRQERWPEISRLLSELYSRAHSNYLSRLKAAVMLDQAWAPSAQKPPAPSSRPLRKKPATVSTPHTNQATRKSRKSLSALKRP